MDSLLYHVQDIPGKGRGLVARSDLAEGTRILCEEPLAVLPANMSEEEMERQLAHQLRALNKLEQRQFLSLHNNVTGKRVFSGIFKTNALPCGPKSSLGAVYPTICFINYSCLLNSCYSWNAAAQMETVYVVRPIKAGEEITVCYTDPENTAARQAHLKNHFGFNCSCELCSLSIIDRKASDARRNQIYQLEEGFFAPGRAIFKPREALLDLRKMLELLNEVPFSSAVNSEIELIFPGVQRRCKGLGIRRILRRGAAHHLSRRRSTREYVRQAGLRGEATLCGRRRYTYTRDEGSDEQPSLPRVFWHEQEVEDSQRRHSKGLGLERFREVALATGIGMIGGAQVSLGQHG